MILEVRPDLPETFRIDAAVSSVQFSERLQERDLLMLAAELRGRPDVLLRVYDGRFHAYTDLDFLAHFPHVRRLSLELWLLGNLDGLEAVRELDEFMFGCTKTKAHSLTFLRRFHTLRKLYLEAHKKDIEVIADLSKVERLTLRSITLPDVELLTALSSLRHLEIKLGGTTNLKALAGLKQLRYLELWLIKGLTDLAVIAEIPSLNFLFLQTLKNVTELPSLRTLERLRGVFLETMKGLTDLRPIAEAPSLESVSLVDMPKLEVDALRCFLGHPSLRAFFAGLGTSKRNAEAEALIDLPHGPNWMQLVASL